MDYPIFCSLKEEYKSPFGAVASGTKVTFTLHVPKDMGVDAPRLFIAYDGDSADEHIMKPVKEKASREKNSAEVVLYRISITPKRIGMHFYWFDLYRDYQKIYRGKGGVGYLTQGTGEAYRLFVHKKDYDIPQWLPGGVIYQIFPDRFNDAVPDKVMPFPDRILRPNKEGEPYFWANELPEGHLNQDYYGGDFEGIRQKLPYLEGLGVNCIYLNPIFEAHSNHRYNTANYMKADPMLGSNDDFARLCAEAKELGIRIILDGVFSHTGDDSVYFDRNARYGSDGAFHNIASPYRSWYHFSPDYPFGYRCWWGFATLPEVNESNPYYRDFICGKDGVIDYWLSLGASGFRLDVADELPDDFIAEIRKAIKARGAECYLLGEVWDDATLKVAYDERRKYLQGDCLDSVMNYPFKDAVIEFIKTGNAASPMERIMQVVENYPAPALATAMNFLSNHDTVRAITEIAGDSLADHDRFWQSGRYITGERLAYGKRLLRLAYAMLFTLPGVPSVYYGDEVYMQGYKDPFNRGYYNWFETDGMLRDEIKNLSALRKKFELFKFGGMELLNATMGFVAYRRYDDKEEMLILINRTAQLKSLEYKDKHINVPPYDYVMIRLALEE